MRLAFALCLVWSSLALADVPGPKTRCVAPAGCVRCDSFDSTCIANAEDAGLVLSDCVDRSGTPSQYVCPPGHPAVATCGCSSVSGFALAMALALLPWLLRRR